MSGQPGFVAATALALFFWSCASSPEGQTGTAEHADEEHPHHEDEHHDDHETRVTLGREAMETIGLRAAAAKRRPFADTIRATAILEPNAYALAHVSPTIPGRASRVQAVLGQRVEAGEVLAELDSIELGERKAAFLEARARLDVARRNAEREKRLLDRSITSEREYFDARGELERAQAGFLAAREALRLVGVPDQDVEEIRWGKKGDPLSHFPLVAPFAGKVIERHITLGERVTPEDKPFTVADLSTVWILLSVHEKDLSRVAVGQTASVRVDAFPDETFEGTLTWVSDILDPATRTAQARVEVPNPDGRLRPGMFARATVSVPAAGEHEAIVIPRGAVQRIEDRSHVFVVEEEGSFRLREIETGRSNEGFIEVLSGLSAGEKVVAEGAFHLKAEIEKETMGGHSH